MYYCSGQFNATTTFDFDAFERFCALPNIEKESLTSFLLIHSWQITCVFDQSLIIHFFSLQYKFLEFRFGSEWFIDWVIDQFKVRIPFGLFF